MATVSLPQAASLSPASLVSRVLPSEPEHSEKHKDTDVDSALTVSFVRALHEDSEESWQDLVQAVSSHQSVCAEGGAPLRRAQARIVHYLHRVFKHVARNSSRLQHLSIAQAIQRAFPELSSAALKRKGLSSARPSQTQEEGQSSLEEARRSTTAAYFSHEMFVLNQKAVPKTFQGQVVRTQDLLGASLATEEELRHFDKVFKKDTITKSDTLQLNMSPVAETLPPLSPVYPSSTDLVSTTGRQDMAHLLEPTDLLKSALDVISAFANGSLDGRVDFVYLNYSSEMDSPKFDPYSLVVVSKAVVNPEHYVISRFGISHVYCDGTKENFSFAEWCSHTIVHRILREIPTFKRFFLQKMLLRWKRNVRLVVFGRRCRQLSKLTMRYFSDFCTASVKVKHLANEVLTLQLFEPQAVGSYTLDAFEGHYRRSTAAARKPLLRLFKLCKQIVSEVEAKKTSELRAVEAEVVNQPFVSDLPISQQREEALQMAARLEAAKDHVSRLPSLTLLVDRMLSSSLVTLVQRSTSACVTRLLEAPSDLDSLQSTTVEDDDTPPEPHCVLQAVFHIEDTTGQTRLTMEPSWEAIRSSLTESLSQMSNLLLEVVQPTWRPTLGGGGEKREMAVHPQPVTLTPHTTSYREQLVSVMASRGVSSTAPPSLTSHQRQQQPLGPVPKRVAEEGSSGAEEGGSPHGVSPLERDNFKMLLLNCDPLVHSVQALEGAVMATEEELGCFLHQQAWLEEAYKHVNNKAQSQATPSSAKGLEVLLSQLELWLHSAACLPNHFLPTSRLVCVSCSTVKEFIHAALKRAHSALIARMHCSAQAQCRELSAKVDRFCKDLTAKRYDLEGFAEYTELVRQCKHYSSSTQSLVEGMEEIITVLTTHNISTGSLYTTLEGTLKKWSSFKELLVSGAAFVEKQTPLRAKGLEENIESHEEDVKSYLQRLNSGMFADPTSTTTLVLAELNEVQNEVRSLSSYMQGLSKWKEIISGSHHDLSLLHRLLALLNVRQELWRAVHDCGALVDEWSDTQFKRLNIAGTVQKVEHWFEAATLLSPTLPKEDPVLLAWIGKLKEFLGNLRLLQRLTSPAIKPHHWHSIFAAMGLPYDHSHRFTLSDLLDYSITEYIDNIVETCLKAEAEHKVEKMLAVMRARWESRRLRVDHVPSKPFSFAVTEIVQPHPVLKEKTTTFALDTDQAPELLKDTFCIVVDTEDLCLWLEDDIMNLQVLLSSAREGKVSGHIAHLLDLLQRVREILSLMTSRQTQWQHFLDLFQGFDSKQLASIDLSALKAATTKIQEVMGAVYSDARVLSLVQKQHGQRGVRELQGNSLRKALYTLQQHLDDQMKVIEDNLMQARSFHPRLFFVSDRDTLRCMVHHPTPLPVLPLLRQCYPGVMDLGLVEVCSQDSVGQEDGYHVMSVKGHLGEELALLSSLPLECRTPVEWLPVLDRAVQLTLSCQLTESLLTVPEELHFSADSDHSPVTTGAVMEWLQRLPSQCTTLALEVTWAHAIASCVDLANGEDLRPALDGHLAAVEHCLQSFSSLMYELPNKMADKMQRRKMFLLLGSLVLLLRNKYDVVSSLLFVPHPLAASFEWQSLLRYHTEQTCLLPEATSSISVSKQAHNVESGLTKNALAYIPTECRLTHLGSSVPYGFEFQGLGHRVFLLPEVERGVVDLLHCMEGEGTAFVSPSGHEASINITRDVAQLLGRPYYSFVLPRCLTHSQACHLMLGVVGTGAVAALGDTGGLTAETAALVCKCVEELRSKLQEKVYPGVAVGRSSVSLVASGSHQIRSAVSATLGEESRHSSSLNHVDSTYQKVDWYSWPFPDCRGLERVVVQLWGAELLASPTSLCCLSLGQQGRQRTLPQGVKEGARCVQWVSPDAVQLVQLLLLASGFQNVPALATALVDLWREIQLLVPAPLQPAIHSCHVFKDIIGGAEGYLLSLADASSEPYYLHSKAKEERALLYGTLASVRRRLSTVLDLEREVLPVCDHYWKEAVDYLRCTVSDQGSLMPDGEEYQVKELSSAVGQELRERHLQELPQMVDKCVSLHRALQVSPTVLLCGCGCTGKSTAYSVLAAAYRGLRAEGGEGASRQYPRVKTIVIHATAHTLQELFGCQEDGHPSLLQMVLHHADAFQQTVESVTHPEASTYPRTKFEELEDQCSAFQHWVILRGPISHEVAMLLAQWAEGGNIVYPGNTEHFSLPRSVKFIIELEDLPHPPCPSLLASSSLIHFSSSTLPWEALVDTWLEEAKTKHNLNTSCRNILDPLMKEGFPLLLGECCKSKFYPCNHNQLVVLFLRLLSAILTRSSSKMRALDGTNDYGSLSHSSSVMSLSASIADAGSSDEEPNPSPSSATAARRRRRSSAFSVGGVSIASYDSSKSGPTSNVDLSQHMPLVFCYATIWATYPVLATCDYPTSVEHDRFVRDVLSQLGLDGEIPSEGLVTDYFVDFKTCTFKTWKERCDGTQMNRNGYITVPEMLKACHFSEVLLSAGHNVMLLGEHGTGKTASVKNQIESKLPLTRLCISLQTSPEQLRNSVMEKHSKSHRSFDMHKGLGLPGKMQKVLLFVDDVHLACSWETGLGSVEETLHQAAAEGCVTDPARSFQQGIHGVRFIASVVPSAVSAFSSRFLCQFVPVLLPNLSSESVSTIFRARISHWLNSALIGQLEEEVVGQLANALVIASVTVHQNVITHASATTAPQLPRVSLKEVMAIYNGMKFLSSHQGESKGFQVSPRKVAAAGREKTSRSSRHRRQSHLAGNLPKPARMKDELTKLARGRRKLKASLETEEEAAKVVLLRSMVRLWCHETARVYGDRFSAPKDCFWFGNLINHVVKVAFCGPAGLKVVELGTRAEQSAAIVTARRREKRLGKNLPILPSTTPDADDNSAALFEDIRRLGFDADLLSQAHLAGKLNQVIPLDQISLRGEDLSRLMFAPSTADDPTGLEVPSTATNLDPSSTSLPPISSTAVIGQRQGHEESREEGKGAATALVYKELDDRDALSVVEGCVQRYSEEVSNSSEEVVPYRALVEQVLRIARALHLASSHAVLLGPRGAGKKTVCQVAACLIDYQVITLALPNNPSQSHFLDCVRKACWSAAAEGRGTALVVSGQLALHQWNSLYLLMKEGDPESVFSGSEIIEMAGQVQQGTSRFSRHLKYSDALSTLKTVLEKNLHILVCWTVQASKQGREDGKKVEERVLPLLLRAASYVGHLAPLDVEACSDVALRWMEVGTDSNWKDNISFTGGISALSELAAHVHTTAARVALRKGTRLTFTPRLLLTCLRMGYLLSLDMQQKEKESIDDAQDVLQALDEADTEVSDIAAHVTAAEGDVEAAQSKVDVLMAAITSHKDEYLEANQRCKAAEAVIAKEGNRVERLAEKLEEAMQQVSAQYTAALHSLSSVQKNDILELMSYNSPPEALKTALNALCIVFDRPESWEDCQQLLLVKNFFEHLQYFDRDNIPKEKLKYLKKTIASKRLDSAFVGRGSQAALSISSWLKALVAYHSAREVMLPHEVELKRARQALSEAKQVYSTKQYKMEETKAALERKIQEHRKALQRLRTLERHLHLLRQNHKEATELMRALLPLRESMEKKRDTATALLHSSPCDGLLVAAAAVYLMTFDPVDQGDLVQTWMLYCHGELEPGELAPSEPSGHSTYRGPEKIPLRNGFSIAGAFVEEEYFAKGFSSLTKSMPVVSERLIIIKFLSSSPGLGLAPLVFDPHHYLFTLAKAQGKGGDVANGLLQQRRRFSQPSTQQRKSSGRISRLSTCSEVLSLPGSSQEDTSLPPLIAADQLELKQIEEILSEDELVYFIFSSAQAIRKEVLDFVTAYIRHSSTSNMALVILQDMDACISCDDTTATSLFQLCLQQSSSSLSCRAPLFTIVDLQLGREDMEEFFRQKVMYALAPTLPIRHRAMLADIATHINSISHAELQLKVSVVSSHSILHSRESIHKLATSSTQITTLAEQRLGDVKSQLARYQKDTEIFRDAAQHSHLLSTCAAKLSSHHSNFPLPLPLFDDLLRKSFKLNQVWQPKEYTSQAGLAATAVEQVNAAVLPFVASCLSQRCFLHYLLMVCLEVWQQGVSREERALISAVGSTLVDALNSCMSEEEDEEQEEGTSSDTVFHSLDKALQNAKFLEAFPGFTGLTHSIESNWELWQEYFQSESCLSGYIPHEFDNLLPSCRLLLWAVMFPPKLPGKVAECARTFVWARVDRTVN